jgi:hypothetical protein
MLEAAKARPRFTISLKRSTQNLQLSTRTPADYPIFWGFGAHILILQEFLALLPGYPHTYPLAEFAGRSRFGAHRRPGEPARYSPSIRRVCSIRISSAMLVCEGEICECAVF